MNFDNGEIPNFVGGQHAINGKGGVVRKFNDSDVASLNDVVVSHNHAVLADKETSALRYRLVVNRHHDGHDRPVRRFGYRGYVFPRRPYRLRSRAQTNAGDGSLVGLC